MRIEVFLENTLKKVPPLYALKNRVFSYIRNGFWHESQITDSLKLFAPYSGSPPSLVTKLAILSANQTFPFLLRLTTDLSGKPPLAVISAETFCKDAASKSTAEQLARLFQSYGSDKSSTHNYHFVYGPILQDSGNIQKLLEIGLGTNNTDIVSNMGASGKPGASIRAFRDFLPNAAIYGADFDSRILFEEYRIKTYFVDQTNLDTFQALGKSVGEGFDLIIDDGLHSPNANLAVLMFALPRLKEGAWVVIEDIKPEALPVWQVVAEILPSRFKCHLIEARGALVFAVQKTP